MPMNELHRGSPLDRRTLLCGGIAAAAALPVGALGAQALEICRWTTLSEWSG
jgi:hypothetical protein